jgi:hypothetical protein
MASKSEPCQNMPCTPLAGAQQHLIVALPSSLSIKHRM